MRTWRLSKVRCLSLGCSGFFGDFFFGRATRWEAPGCVREVKGSDEETKGNIADVIKE